MRILSLMAGIFLGILPLQSGLVIQDDKGNLTQGNGVPLILYSCTIIRSGGAIIQNDILSIFEDGACSLKRSIDNSKDKTAKGKKGMIIRNYGPYPLKEEIRAALQTFFSSGANWTLAEKSHLSTHSTDIWLAQLSLSFTGNNTICYLSSTEKQYQELSSEGIAFLDLLEKIKKWLIAYKPVNI